MNGEVVYRFELDDLQEYATIQPIYSDGRETRMKLRKLPPWMVSQLNMLRRLPPAEEGVSNRCIKGVGRRISSMIYWIVKPPKEELLHECIK